MSVLSAAKTLIILLQLMSSFLEGGLCIRTYLNLHDKVFYPNKYVRKSRHTSEIGNLNLLNIPKQVREDIFKKGILELLLQSGKRSLGKEEAKHS